MFVFEQKQAIKPSFVSYLLPLSVCLALCLISVTHRLWIF